MTAPHIPRPSSWAKKSSLKNIYAVKVSATGKTLLSPVAQPAELAARNKAERLKADNSNIPLRNSTMRGQPYTCPELRTNPYRPGSMDAYSLPSRTQFK